MLHVDRNHLVQGLLNIMDGAEKNNLNPIFFLRDSCWMWSYVIVEKHKDSLNDKSRAFSLEIFLDTLQFLNL